MIIEFKHPYGAYTIGDRAGFAPDMAQRIIAKGAAIEHIKSAPQAVEPEMAVEAPQAFVPKRAYRKRSK